MLLMLLTVVLDAATIDVKLAPYYAAGDGTTDDTSAIQSAINANPNSVILLKDGTFKITSILTLKTTRTLQGDAGTLLYSSASCGTMISCESNVDILNLAINGNNQSTSGIYVGPNLTDINVQSCELFNFAGNSAAPAFAINIRDNCSYVNILQTKIHDVDGGGNGVQGDTIGADRAIYIRGVTNTVVDNCEIYNIGPWEDGDCIQVQASGASGVIIRNSKFYNFMKRAVKIQASGVVVTNNLISCAYADDGVNAPAEGVGVLASNCEISSNIIILNRASWAISVSGGCSNVQVTNNITDIYGYYYTGFTNMTGYYFYQCRCSFIRAMFLGESNDCTFDGNTSFAYFRGMHIRNSYNNTISNNNVLASLYPYMLTDGSTSSNNTMTNNTDYSTALLGFWRFNDSSDITTAFDFPDGTYQGTCNNFTSGQFVNGVIGNALSFNGTNSFVYLGDVLDMGNSDFSICAWVKSTSTVTGSNSNGIVYKRGTGSNTAPGYRLSMPNGCFNFHIAGGTNYASLTVGVAGSYNNGSWHHVAAVADRGVNVKIYVDGTLAGTLAETNVGNIDSTTYLSIGGLTLNGTNCYHPFSGSIDEVMIFNKALTADEVSKIYSKKEIK
ncbi:MAG: LamG-like jellyroll fold domain-containing protein [Victivallaceae bacterium]